MKLVFILVGAGTGREVAQLTLANDKPSRPTDFLHCPGVGRKPLIPASWLLREYNQAGESRLESVDTLVPT